MRNIPTKYTGDSLTANEFNDIPGEEENLITSTGQTLSAADLYQIAKAVAMYAGAGDFYSDSGSGNTYILNAEESMQAPTRYKNGLRIRYEISHTNTGPAQVNVNSLGLKDIVKEDATSPLSPGDLPIGQHAELIFYANIDKFVLYSHKYDDQVFLTGDNLWSDRNSVRPGWILVNDNTKTTIGDASSTATIRANADCETLYKLYWEEFSDSDCPVEGGRGLNAAADWAAHRNIAIPSAFRRVFAAHDINDAVRIGQVEGEKTHALTADENGQHNHAPSAGKQGFMVNDATGGDHYASGGNPFFIHATTANSGLGTAHNNMQPTVYKNLYIKL